MTNTTKKELMADKTVIYPLIVSTSKKERDRGELMAEVIKTFGFITDTYNIVITPEVIRAYATRMAQTHNLCPFEIFSGIEASYFITVYTKK